MTVPDQENRPLLLFDLDGTLWDCTSLSLEAWNRTLADSGIRRQISDRELKKAFGLPSPDFERRLLPEMEDGKRSALAEQVFEMELNLIPQGFGELYPDVMDVLRKLEKTYNMAIVSNCQDGYIEAFITRFFPDGTFCDWESSGRTGHPKDENVAAVLKRGRTRKAVLVGDTSSDRQAALANDLPFIQAVYGFGKPLHSKLHIHSFHEILAILMTLAGEKTV